MTSRHVPRCRIGLFVLAIALCFSGCQQMGRPFGSAWDSLAGTSRAQPSAPSMPPTPKLDRRQQADVEMAMARTLERQGSVEAAAKVYEEVVRKDESRADAYHRLGLIYAKRGECGKAEECYLGAIQREPDNAELLCDLGYTYYLQKRFPEAERTLRKAVALDPHLRRGHNNLGLVLGRTGRANAALNEFTLAGCSQAESHSNLGVVLTTEERFDEARHHFELAAKADPSATPAREGLAALDAVKPTVVQTSAASEPAATSPHAWPGQRLAYNEMPAVKEFQPGGDPPQQRGESMPRPPVLHRDTNRFAAPDVRPWTPPDRGRSMIAEITPLPPVERAPTPSGGLSSHDTPALQVADRRAEAPIAEVPWPQPYKPEAPHYPGVSASQEEQTPRPSSRDPSSPEPVDRETASPPPPEPSSPEPSSPEPSSPEPSSPEPSSPESLYREAASPPQPEPSPEPEQPAPPKTAHSDATGWTYVTDSSEASDVETPPSSHVDSPQPCEAAYACPDGPSYFR